MGSVSIVLNRQFVADFESLSQQVQAKAEHSDDLQEFSISQKAMEAMEQRAIAAEDLLRNAYAKAEEQARSFNEMVSSHARHVSILEQNVSKCGAELEACRKAMSNHSIAASLPPDPDEVNKMKQVIFTLKVQLTESEVKRKELDKKLAQCRDELLKHRYGKQ